VFQDVFLPIDEEAEKKGGRERGERNGCINKSGTIIPPVEILLWKGRIPQD